MNAVILKAHYDGKHICLGDLYPLEPNTRLLATVFPGDTAQRSGAATQSSSSSFSSASSTAPFPMTRTRTTARTRDSSGLRRFGQLLIEGERRAWSAASQAGFARAYGEKEPDYSAAVIREQPARE